MKKLSIKNFPNAYVIIFFILIVVSILTYIIPSGEFDRSMNDETGRIGVVPGTFHYIEKTDEMRVSPWWDLFVAIPKGIVETGIVMSIVFLSGGLFKIFSTTGCIESAIGITIKKINQTKMPHSFAVIFLTFFFGFFGGAVGFENLIPFVPLGVMIALGLGYDIMVGAAVAIGSIAVGFATSPINPYTVGTSHAIAGLPVFSGIGYRSVFCLLALTICAHHTLRYIKKIRKDPEKSLTKGINASGLAMSKNLDEYSMDSTQKILITIFMLFIVVVVFGVVQFGWYLNELSALFILVAIIVGIILRWSPNKIVEVFLKGASEITGGALVIGFARSINVIMSEGKIADTIINALAEPLANLSPTLSAIGMTVVQGIINFFIPSGSGQAMATMPIIIPLADIIGVTRQIAVQAFQIGDGVINLIIPTAGGLMAMLALARVPFDRWFKFIFPLAIKLYLLGWVFLAVVTAIGWE